MSPSTLSFVLGTKISELLSDHRLSQSWRPMVLDPSKTVSLVALLSSLYVKGASCSPSDVPRRKLRPRRGHEADKKSRLHAHIGGSISEITFARASHVSSSLSMPITFMFRSLPWLHSGYKHSRSRVGVIDKGK